MARLRRVPEGWWKTYSSPRAVKQARRALTAWRHPRMPQVLEQDGSRLLLSHLEGQPSCDWASAGAWRRGFAQPQDQDPMPLHVALQKRMESWSAALAAFEPVEPWRLEGDHTGLARVRCHRDFQPRNWVMDDQGFGVLDFEHAAPDHPLTDAVKVLDHILPDSDAFRAFMGRALTPAEGAQLRDLRLIHGLASRAWGHRHGDPEFLDLGQRVLAGL